MGQYEQLFTPQVQARLQQLAKEASLDGQRASALLAMYKGRTQAEAAEDTELTLGQVKYIRRRFMGQGLEAFEAVPAASPPPAEPAAAAPAETPQSATEERLSELVAELDGLVAELKTKIPQGPNATYSPLHLLTTIRENISGLAPDVQIGILQSFEDSTVEDLMDPETWKGLAYMLSYSARFQAGQLKTRLNEQLPDPFKPDTVIGSVMQGVDKVTPELIKDLAQNLQGTSVEDWKDPETWKGMWYMINYSLQFQVNQLKDRLGGQATDETA